MMNWFYDYEWSDAPLDERDRNRMKAYLSFEEEEDEVKAQTPPYRIYYYKNLKNELVPCRILIKRDNGEVVVERSNGCRICLTEKDLYESKTD
jgi:hypothetical protein